MMTDQDLLRLALNEAVKSPDPSTQNGAILAYPDGTPLYSTVACNEFPRGVQYLPARWERPIKYGFIEHAERNAIFNAARAGIPTEGLVMACPWAACADCGRAIIQAGIKRLVTVSPTADTHDRWMASIEQAMTMLAEAGVEVTMVQGPIENAPRVRRMGDLITV